MAKVLISPFKSTPLLNYTIFCECTLVSINSDIKVRGGCESFPLSSDPIKRFDLVEELQLFTLSVPVWADTDQYELWPQTRLHVVNQRVLIVKGHLLFWKNRCLWCIYNSYYWPRKVWTWYIDRRIYDRYCDVQNVINPCNYRLIYNCYYWSLKWRTD